MYADTNSIVLKTDTVQVREMYLAPGQSLARHYHTEITDTMYCLQGSIRITLDDPREDLVLQPGDRCVIPPGRRHAAGNSAPGPSVYLLVQGVGAYDFIED